MWPQAEGPWEPPEAGRGGRASPQNLRKENELYDTLSWDFRAPELGGSEPVML